MCLQLMLLSEITGHLFRKKLKKRMYLSGWEGVSLVGRKGMLVDYFSE